MKVSLTGRVLLAAALTLSLGLGAVAAAFTPAQAATGFVASPNGMMGIAQEVMIYAPNLKGQPITIGFSLGSAGSSQSTIVGSNGYGSMNWTPNLAGSWTVSSLGSAIGVGSTNVTIAAMATITKLYMPTNVTSNAIAQVLVHVSAQAGILAPEGTVKLASSFGTSLGTLGLTPIAGGASSQATFNWRPQTLGEFPLVATFTPSSSGALASASSTGSALIVSNAGLVQLRLPATFRVGQPTVLSALVTPTTTVGSAAFQLNGGYLSASIPLSNGVSTTQWTPTQQGIQTVITQFSSSILGGPSGQVSQAINVLAALPADVISVSTPNGAWGADRPISIMRGSNTLLSVTAASGTQVLLSESGPCVINGAIITGLGTGSCKVTATTVGSGGYTAASVDFDVAVITAPKKKKR